MSFNYKIVEHIEDQENVLMELSEEDILFVNIAPIQHSNQIFISNNKILTPEELAEYDGNFSFVLRDTTVNDEIIDTFNQIYNILSTCEQNESIISIKFKSALIIDDSMEFIENPNVLEQNPLEDFSTILNMASIALVTKTFRIEENNSIINMISMAYKSSE